MKALCKKCGSDKIYIEVKQFFSQEREQWEVRTLGQAKCEVCNDYCEYRYEPLITSYTCFDCRRDFPCDDLGKYLYENEVALCNDCLQDREWDRTVDSFKRL
jgi:hypothetical protein